jgi:hypothetical protein
VTHTLPRAARHAAPSAFITVSPSRQRELSAVYRALPLIDSSALPAWHAFREETLRQLDTLTRAGIEVVIDDVDPYAAAVGPA